MIFDGRPSGNYRASTVDEPDLFNDVEIMEIGDFNTESDENYVSVELLSENDDEDETDDVSLDTIPFCPPQDLLCTSVKLHPTTMAIGSDAALQCEQDKYPMVSIPHDRFLSDHQYLVGSSMHHIIPKAETNDQIAMHVQHISERFSVSYDMDIRTQDLFNEECNNIVNCANLIKLETGNTSGEYDRGMDTTLNAEDGDYLESKIEIGETMVQSFDIVGHEEISACDDALSDSVDEVDDPVLKALLDGMPCVTQVDNADELTPLENDHSYTTRVSGTPQSTVTDESCVEGFELGRDGTVAELVSLSNKLANEQDVTSVDAKQIAAQIEETVQSFRKRQETTLNGNHAVREENKGVADADSLSVMLSSNCSERLESEGGIPSSSASVGTMNGNGNYDSGTDTDCTAAQTISASELDELIQHGDCFAKQCEQWLQKNSIENDKSVKPVKLARLMTILETLKGQCIRLSSPSTASQSNKTPLEKIEMAVQTDFGTSSAEWEQCALNEKYKKTMLAAASDSSSLSYSDGSVRTTNTDSDMEGEDMMTDFVRRRRMRKTATEKRNKTSLSSDFAKDSDGPRQHVGANRRNQIYSDSSSASDDDKKPAHKNRPDRTEADDNLLDGVLSGVDDIMLDVHDILPAAEVVVQDYLEKEEVRKKRQEESKEQTVEGAKKSVPVKSLKDMTESEMEEYNEAQQDKEINRLCNLSCLSVGRNTVAATVPAVVTKAKEAQQKRKKVQNTMEDFLNDGNSSNSTIPLALSDNSDGSDKDVADTEEQFLHKCNENMKYQLLNQLSSSNDSSDDGVKDIARNSDDNEKSGSDDDSEASSGSVLESFLKGLDTKRNDRIQPTGKSRPGDGTDVFQAIQIEEIGANIQRSNSVKSVGDQTVLNDVSDKGPGSGEEENDGIEKGDPDKQLKVSRKQEKLELADPKDRPLFSNDVFKDGDERNSKAGKLSKGKHRRRLDSLGAPISCDSDKDGDKTSTDSDVELLHDSSKKRKRTRNHSPSLQPFDFNEPLLSVTTARKDSLNSSNVMSRSDQSPLKSSATRTTTTSAASPVRSEPSSTAVTANQKSSAKEDQDCISLSSDSDAETEPITADLDDSSRAPQETKRKIRAMLTNDELAEETKKAQKEEEGRATRLRKKNELLKKFLPTFRPRAGESELVLDYDSVQKTAICVHPEIVKLLKPHQVEGIKFMYDNTYGSVDALTKHQGSGCILAHCMGLGKTLQMIALLHTVMRYPQLLTRRVLVICPKSTVMNWKEEIIRWQGTIKTGYKMEVFFFADVCTQDDKISRLREWFTCASPVCGVMLIGYEAFRALINYERRKRSADVPSSSKMERIKEYLLNPGADLVICDEGHQIKNKRSAISEAVSKIKTKRRIMLTGTPIQNNLKEYYCMVNFIKPSFLGSDKEFSNLYANPIKNGQCKDSDQRAIKIMKQRSYVLHNKLSKFVQRKEAAVLKEFLPEKYEYVLFVPLTPVQEKMYEVFLQMNEYTSSTEIAGEPGRTKKFKLIADYTSLRKIWTHPKVLEKAWESANQEKMRKDAARKTATPDSYDESPDDTNDIASGQLSVTNDWWRQFLEVADLESLFPSNKLWIMFEILKQCNERGEKCLIFSAFVAVLNVVEHFMEKIHNQESDQQHSDAYAYSAFKGPWVPGMDYYRLDGKTHKSIRHKMITWFNDPLNTRTKCFLISAKAGGQGINLTGANRVIILDTSWNPSNDQQNIFRIFRLGQKRKCYVYRLLAMGTMEEKVYSRSVTKQALSFRVVDEQQIDRHYSYGELAELYTLTKVSEMTRETPILPADDVLALLLRIFPNKIFKYHEHDSLLENKPEQDLSEEDKKEAWAAYEREIQTNDNRSLISAWGNIPQAGLFSQPGPYSRLIDYWGSLGVPGIPGQPPIAGAGDMFRTDYSYNRSYYNAYANAQQQQYSMLGDTAFASMLPKPYGSYPVTSPGGLDYGSQLMNGQSPGAMAGLAGAGKPYDPTAALANFFSLYSTKSPSAGTGMSAGLGVTNQGQLPPPSTSHLAGSPYSSANSSAASAHFNAFKQLGDYNTLSSALHTPQQSPSTGLSITNVASLSNQLHKSSAAPGGQPIGNLGAGNATMLSLLNEQAQLAAAASSSFGSAGVSSPFSPRNVPLLPPTIEAQMRNIIGASSITQSPRTQSPKTQSPMSPQTTSSVPSTNPNQTKSTVNTGNGASSANTVTTAASSFPKITSVVSMAPHASKASDSSLRTDIQVNYSQTPFGLNSSTSSSNAVKNHLLANKTYTSNHPPATNSTVRSVTKPPKAASSLGSSPLGDSKRTPTSTIVRASSSSEAARNSPTVIPSDDEDERDVTNKTASSHATTRDVGGNGKTKGSENRNAGNNALLVHPSGQPQTESPIGIKDLLKSAKSLTNLSQHHSKAKQPLDGTGATGRTGNAQNSQTPPPIISTPSARPFQTFVRSNSSTAFTSTVGSGHRTLAKAAVKENRQSPSFMKLTPSTTKSVHQQQQQVIRPSLTPARNPATAQLQSQKGLSNNVAATQLLKPLTGPPALTMKSSLGFTSQPGSPVTTTHKGTIQASGITKQQLAPPATRQPPIASTESVTKSLQRPATDESKNPTKTSAGLMSVAKQPIVLSSGVDVGASMPEPGYTLTKSNYGNSSNRLPTKPIVERRPSTLSLTLLQSGNGTADANAASNQAKKLAPLLPKTSQSTSTIANIAAASQSNRGSPVGVRPIGVVQKPVPAPQVTPVMIFSSTDLNKHTRPVTVNRMPSPVSTGAKTIALNTAVQQASANLRSNAIRVSPSSPTVINRITKGTPSMKINSTASVTTSPSTIGNMTVTRTSSTVPIVPPIPAFAARSHITGGAMTVIPAVNVNKLGAMGSTTNSLSITGTSNAKPTVSYSFKHASKELVITKAIASPSIRQISPAQGQHLVVKSTAPTVTMNTAGLSERKSFNAPLNAAGSTSGAPARSIVPMVRGTNVAATNLPLGNFQPGATNNVFIRKRKNDATLLESMKAKHGSLSISELRSEPNIPAKRSKANEPTITTSFAATNRLAGSITNTPKIAPAKEAPKDGAFEVVELE